MNYEIEKDVPIPATTKKYPWNDMEVGDSFFIPDGQPCASASHRKRYGEDHTTRKVEGGIRIWRVK